MFTASWLESPTCNEVRLHIPLKNMLTYISHCFKILSKPAFLTLGTTDILGWIIVFSEGVSSVLWGVYSIPGLHLLNANSTPALPPRL